MGVVRRALGGMDDDPVLVVDEHRLVRLEDRDIYVTLPVFFSKLTFGSKLNLICPVMDLDK